jgi:transposase
MNERLTVTSERVDDTPLLLAQIQRMDVPGLLDRHFPAHGNWQGLSPGWVAAGWMSHILSEANHRLNHVQPWAEKRLETLAGSMGQPVRALDFSDDRLAGLLDLLSADEHWRQFETALNQQLLRVYDLPPERVRLDSTTASGHWEVTPAGLFQFGHSKDRRPDLAQVKVMLAALDPLGLPLITTVVAGNRADDPLYGPMITQVRESLGRRGLLYVGDCKMGALATRAALQAGGDFYLCPLSATQLPAAELAAYLEPVWTAEQALQPVERATTSGEVEVIAEGFERPAELTATVGGVPVGWTERRLVLRSVGQAQAAAQALRARLAKAQAALAALNERKKGKKRPRDVETLRQQAAAIEARYQVAGLLQLTYGETVREHPVGAYGRRPAEIRQERDVWVQIAVDEVALQAACQRLGWQVYATNHAPAGLSLTEATLAYRSEYLIERCFGRLKGKPLTLTPMYLQDDGRATGLIRLLTICLRALTLLEFGARRRLAEEQAELAGLYAGNPKRATARPTAERLLEAFEEITLTVIRDPQQTRRHLTPLSPLQQRILELLDFQAAIYTQLCSESLKPP